MSSSSPNMQNIPRDKAFRGLFRAPEGRAFVIADYSQMELRVAAIMAGEKSLLEAYREGRDTHALTAAMLLGITPDEVTKDQRQLAKAVNFGLLYGQGAKGLQAYAETTYGVAIRSKRRAPIETPGSKPIRHSASGTPGSSARQGRSWLSAHRRVVSGVGRRPIPKPRAGSRSPRHITPRSKGVLPRLRWRHSGT